MHGYTEDGAVMEKISWSDFQKIQICVGIIVEVLDFPEARKPAYRLKVDLGESLGVKQSSAQVTKLYSKEDLEGQQVVCVVNFPTKQIGPVRSEALVTGFHGDDETVALCVPERKVPNGSRLV